MDVMDVDQTIGGHLDDHWDKVSWRAAFTDALGDVRAGLEGNSC
jgi:hypothetical protein